MFRGTTFPYELLGNLYPGVPPSFGNQFENHPNQGNPDVLLAEQSILENFNRTAGAVFMPISQMYNRAIDGKGYTVEQKKDLWDVLENSINQVLPNYYQLNFNQLEKHDIDCNGADMTSISAEKKRHQETDVFVQFEHNRKNNTIEIITHKRGRAFSKRDVEGQKTKGKQARTTKMHPLIQRPYTKTQMTINLNNPSATPEFKILEARTTFDGDTRPIYGTHTFETLARIEEANNAELTSMVSKLSMSSNALNLVVSGAIQDVANPENELNKQPKASEIPELNVGGKTYDVNYNLLHDTSRQLPKYEIYADGKMKGSKNGFAPQNIAILTEAETPNNSREKAVILNDFTDYLSVIDTCRR